MKRVATNDARGSRLLRPWNGEDGGLQKISAISDCAGLRFARRRRRPGVVGVRAAVVLAARAVGATERISRMSSKVSAIVSLAHGASLTPSSMWMHKKKKSLSSAGHAVSYSDADYADISGGKRRAPPKAEKLVDHHLEIVKVAVQKHPDHPLVLVGKSMGSRHSCFMKAYEDDTNISTIICLGYPLKGMNGAVRDETLLQLTVPTMFVQGSKDSLCPLDKLEATRKKMKCVNSLHVIDGGDHSFKIGKKFLNSRSNQDEIESKALKSITEFCYNQRKLI
ncbi:hypothetical protein KSP40_PGU009406 [Platanthera guangdongensis]|uniref:KANL3/Tex30 alpha/beta hydrolase-like domain-containing protein n=1 Tax=Platanthera guangdongensis TaxID=2320717 RepID=A0ABR2LFQ2_9ASPA